MIYSRYKAGVSWQWFNAIKAENIAQNKGTICINLDETYVGYYHGNVKGNLAVTNRRLPDGILPLTQAASRKHLRMGLTHVGIVCDSRAAQKLLPQVLIVPSKHLTLRDLRATKPLMPPNIYILRRESKWISTEIVVWIIYLIHACLRRFRPTHTLVLLMDVLAQHFHPSVLAAAEACGIKLFFVPAKLTWLLQPCDTHTFSLYKRQLRKLFLRWRSRNGVAMPGVSDWLLMIRDVIVDFMNERSWANAFKEDGFGDNQADLSKYIRSHLPFNSVLPVPTAIPSTDSLRLVFPKTRTTINVEYFRGLLGAPPPKALT